MARPGPLALSLLTFLSANSLAQLDLRLPSVNEGVVASIREVRATPKPAPPAAQGPLALHAPVTHWPLSIRPVVVLQIVVEPYVASAWHCESVAHAPQVFALWAPHTRPERAPVQSPLVPWQLPGWQMPWKQMWPVPYCGSAAHSASVEQPPQVFGAEIPHSWPVGQSLLEPWQSPEMQPPERHTVDAPYDGSTLQAVSLMHALQVRVGTSQIRPPAQSDDTRHWPGTHTFPMQRCCGP